jgi:hypothetical protein
VDEEGFLITNATNKLRANGTNEFLGFGVQMRTEKQRLIISKAIKRLGFQLSSQENPLIHAVDEKGKTYHFKYRTRGLKSKSLSFDFKYKSGELEGPYDFFVGVFITKDEKLREIFRVRRTDVYDMANSNEDSLRLRWNDDMRSDPRVKFL